MATDQAHTDHFDSIIEEHRQLRAVLDRIQAALARKRDSLSRVVALFDELETYLLAHFAHEERGGYFAEVLVLSPGLRGKVEQLERQHPQFMRMIRELRAAAADGQSSDVWWLYLGERFEDFAHRFVEHETDENHLVQEAFLRDMAAED
jgi:hemerythrin